jgi:ubiquinone/menaquinone biosynthesis C-methylase UbiE
MSHEKSAHQGHHHAGKSSEHYLNKEVILKELHIFPGQTILDAGCGNGYMAKEFSRILNKTGKVYALDPDERAISVLKEQTKDTNITPILGDISKKTEIAAASIDLIYLSTVFHGFVKSQIDGFQKEVRRLLKPKGTLAIIEIKKDPTPFGPPMDIRFSPPELREVINLSPKKLVEAGQFFYMQLFENQE